MSKDEISLSFSLQTALGVTYNTPTAAKGKEELRGLWKLLVRKKTQDVYGERVCTFVRGAFFKRI
jgi:hypothetical protein